MTVLAHHHASRLWQPGQLICLSGCFAMTLSSPVRENISLRRLVETALLIPPSRPKRGALAIVTNVGAGCGGRGSVGRATESQGGF
jgi:hypothetical protein